MSSFSLFSLTFLFVPVCMSKGRKAKGFVSVQKLYDSCFLRFDLRAVHSPGINHFRLSKQFPITVSIFRFLYGGEKREPRMLTLVSERQGGGENLILSIKSEARH